MDDALLRHEAGIEPATLKPMTIMAAADGSSLGNPGPAGWAWFISEDCWAAGGWELGTNNLGELTAVLELLTATQAAGVADQELHILTDSQYAINVITRWMAGWKRKGWRKADKKPIKNLQLIQEIDRAIAGRNVHFTWVKGHAGQAMNEAADARARACAEAYQHHRPVPAGPGFPTNSTERPELEAHGASIEDTPTTETGVQDALFE